MQIIDKHIVLTIESREIPCVVSFKKVRAVYFKIKPDGSLHVTAPLTYKKNILPIVLTKSKWILHHMDLMKTKTKLITSDTVLYLGEPLSLVIQPIMTGKQSAKIETNEITLLIKDPKKRDKWLDSLLKIHTTSFVESILPDWIQKTGLTPKHVRYRKMKKWGACTKNGNLIFNSYLICLPPALIHYIVFHELVHLQHFNHSQNFHEAVAIFLPPMKKLEKDLKMYVR